MVAATKRRCEEVLKERIGWDSQPRKGDRSQTLDVRFLQGLLRLVEDPDAELYEIVAKGVPLCVYLELPRTPFVLEEKTEWNLNKPEDGMNIARQGELPISEVAPRDHPQAV